MAGLTESSPSSRAGLQTVAPALRSPNFRRFWFGQLVSTAGTSLQVVAEGWLIYEITQSTFWLGAVGFIALLPVVPVSLFGGILIDRLPRRKLILATQAALLLQAAIFGLLALTGAIRLWHIIALYFVFGALLAIDHPARRAFLVELVEADDLSSAIALNATLFNVSSLVGYAAAGLLIATIGAGGTMLINAATYLATIIALAMIRGGDIARDVERPRLRVALSEGFIALWREPALLRALSLMAVVGGLAAPVFGLMPAFAEEVLHTGSIGLGFLLAAGAFGSVLGTVIVARIQAEQREIALTLASLLLPLLVMGFAWSGTLGTAALALALLGMALLVLQTMAITLVQLQVPERVRGRVMTLYSQLHAGSDTGATALAGGLATYLGLPLALTLGGGAALLYALGLYAGLPLFRGPPAPAPADVE